MIKVWPSHYDYLLLTMNIKKEENRIYVQFFGNKILKKTDIIITCRKKNKE